MLNSRRLARTFGGAAIVTFCIALTVGPVAAQGYGGRDGVASTLPVQTVRSVPAVIPTVNLDSKLPEAFLIANRRFRILVSGYLPGSWVRFVLRSDPVLLGEFQASETGVVDVEVPLPAGTPTGDHHVVATGKGTSGEELTKSVAVKVAPAAISADSGPDRIAFTGSNSANMAALGGILVVTGFAATLAARRRIAFTQEMRSMTQTGSATWPS